VDFGYVPNPTQAVLRKCRIQLRKNALNVIVGPSGSGKSTILNLLLGLYRPQSGQVLINGQDLWSGIPRNSVLKQTGSTFALLEQAPSIFSRTVLENALYGSTATDAQVNEMLRLVGLEPLIGKLPQGLQTKINDIGSALSCGEKQRLCFARELLKQPTLLALDEPLSALDSASQEIIMNILTGPLRSQCTIVMIAHQLESVQHADRIFFVQNGGVQEEGSHTELMAKGGAFSHFVGVSDSLRSAGFQTI